MRSAYIYCYVSNWLVVQYFASLCLYLNPVLFTDVYSHFYRAMQRRARYCYGTDVRPFVCLSIRKIEVLNYMITYTLAKKVAYVAKLNVAFWLMYCDVAYMAT